MSKAVVFEDLRAEVEVPKGGILSRALHTDEHASLTVFAFDTGQELTEHTASRAALVEVLDGSAEIGVAGELHQLGPGGWLAMPPRTPHSVRALAPLKMALVLLGPA